MTRLDPPETVRGIAKRLEDAGFETWCVGGAVRDALLGHPHLDWDLATRATPTEVRRLFKRTLPLAVEFATIGALDQDNVMHEVTTVRRDVTTDAFNTLIPSLAQVTDRQLAPLDHLRRPLLPRRPARRSTRIAALLASVPAPTVRKTLKDLRFSNSETEWIAILVERWQQLGQAMTDALLKAEEVYAKDPWGDQYPPSSVLRQWAASAGRTRLASLLRLADAFWWAARQAGEPAPYKQTIGSVYKRAIKIAYKDPISLSDLAIDGTDTDKM